MADIIGTKRLFNLILSYNLMDGAGTDDRGPSLCHDQCQFTIDGYPSSVRAMADIIGTRRLFNGILSQFDRWCTAMINANSQLTDLHHHSAMSRSMADTCQLWIVVTMVG